MKDAFIAVFRVSKIAKSSVGTETNKHTHCSLDWCPVVSA